MAKKEHPTILWKGKSGEKYEYRIYPIGTKFKAVPGNYIFAKEQEPKKWLVVYVGETDDLSTRFDSHHKMECIEKEEATHIHVHESSEDEEVRRAEEIDIVENYKSPCND